ncbi:MAG: glycosyltransferase family 39 protein [bacterium]
MERSPVKRSWFILAGVFVILCAMLVIEITTSLQESQTIDESVHLAAGLSYLTTGDFRMNPEHPPFIKMLAASPLLFTNATLPIADPSWKEVKQWVFATRFLYHNALSPDTLLLLGRLPIMLLSIVLGWFIFRESRRMFGIFGGLLSLGLFAFEPSIIAHSRLVTTDLGFAAASFLALVRLERLFRTPTRRNAIWFAVALWVAMVTKFSFFAFAIALLGTFLLLKWYQPTNLSVQWRHVRRFLGWSLLIGVFATWAVYCFTIKRPINDPKISQLYAQRQHFLAHGDVDQFGVLGKLVVNQLGNPSTSIGRLAIRLEQVPIPLYAFFRGGISVLGHSYGGQWSFLLGQVRDLGWWYYFPVALFAKTSPSMLAAFLLVPTAFVTLVVQERKKQGRILAALRAIDHRWIVYGVTPIIFFLISMNTHLNLGWRHILPIYPPLLVLAGSLSALPWVRSRRSAVIIPLVLIAGSIATEAATYPNQIGYFSPFVGGNGNGYNILRDSNLDWGQDLKKLSTYLRQHHAPTVAIAYYGNTELSAYLPNPQKLPTTAERAKTGQPHGYVALSGENLYSTSGNYDWIKAYPQIAQLGSSIFVFWVR